MLMSQKSTDKIFSRHWTLTYFLSDDEVLKDVFVKVDTFMSFYMNSNFLIGAEEFTDKEKRHCHIVLSFVSAISFDIIKRAFPSQHIERVRVLKECLAYVSKMGVFYSSYDSATSKKQDVYKDFIDDVLLDVSLRELIKKYPQFFLRNYSNTISLIKVLKGIDLPYDEKDSKIKNDNFL